MGKFYYHEEWSYWFSLLIHNLNLKLNYYAQINTMYIKLLFIELITDECSR